jgi:hypothetical protein
MEQELFGKLVWFFTVIFLLSFGIYFIVKSVRIKKTINNIIKLDPSWISRNPYEYAHADTKREVLLPIGVILAGVGLFMLVIYVFGGVTF